MANYVYLDTETTGFDPKTQDLLEVSIIDDQGKVLLDTLVKPRFLDSWPRAQAIHHISPEMCAKAPSYDEVISKVIETVANKDVIIYNVGFDAKFVPLKSAASVKCCMLAWAEYKGMWDDYHQNYKWFKLADAAKEINHSWQGNAHRALADVYATRDVWHHLIKAGKI